jgi:hypothetical protein
MTTTGGIQSVPQDAKENSNTQRNRLSRAHFDICAESG